jgi:DNA polymerase-3 subunit delta'
MTYYPWQKQNWLSISKDFNQLPNAWLFYGQPGIGKIDFAHAVAATLLCKNPLDNQHACNHCVSCHWFNRGHHPDFYVVTPTVPEIETDTASRAPQKLSVIKIEAIQQMVNFTTLSSHQAALRIVLIAPAENMTIAAANALLKILEEPSKTLLFLLVSHAKTKLLPTIVSRCRQFPLNIPSYECALDWLKKQSVDDAETILALQSGSPLINHEATYTTLHQAFIAVLSKPTLIASLNIAEEIDQKKVPLPLALTWLSKWLFDLIAYQLSSTIRFHPYEKSSLQKLAQWLNSQALFSCYDKIQAIRIGELQALNTRMQIETLLMEYRRLFTLSDQANHAR